ncbi:unnamed protein product, partial [Owenia fusiformis]
EVKKCFTAARANQKRIIGVEYGGECFTSRSGYGTYNKYGLSTNCTGYYKDSVDTGGPWALSVYAITSYPLRYSVTRNKCNDAKNGELTASTFQECKTNCDLSGFCGAFEFEPGKQDCKYFGDI